MTRHDQLKRRTRDGCWTCRKRYVRHSTSRKTLWLTVQRKKKCDGTGAPCQNCSRLGLSCETQTKLVWEDDARRVGMSRRGPSLLKNGVSLQFKNRVVLRKSQSTPPFNQDGPSKGRFIPKSDQRPLEGSPTALGPLSHLTPLVQYQQLSAYPRSLDQTESLLLEQYVQRFSREYPTCSGPNNPFPSVLLPLAMESSVVLDSLLSLSGAQRWEHDWAPMEQESLKLRQRALRGCRELLIFNNLSSIVDESRENGRKIPNAAPTPHQATLSCRVDTKNDDNVLFLLASSVLFLLYEKVSGQPT